MSNPYLDGVYNVGTVTLTAGSKDFTTKNANLRSDAPILAGDRIHVNGKELIIEAITDTDKGRLYYDCPSDCAGTDIPLVITLISSPARIQSNTAKLIEKLSKGYLPSLAELTASEGQIFCATNVQGELRASDLNADNISETGWRKFMTADERNKLASINSLDQNTWNSGNDWTTALISPQNLISAIKSTYRGDVNAGWVKYINGLIIQWGKVAADKTGNNSYGMAYFPTTFTSYCIFIPTIAQGWPAEGFSATVYAEWGDTKYLDKRGFYCSQTNGSSVTGLHYWDVNWIAIGF